MSKIDINTQGQESSAKNLDSFDFWIEVYIERIEDNGEDRYYYNIGNNFVAGVFDGCGGAGGKKYPALQNKTGAYLAAQAAAAAIESCNLKSGFEQPTHDAAVFLKNQINENLLLVKEKSGHQESKLKSSLMKDFPTTMALFARKKEHKKEETRIFWAGDSRCYWLDQSGLHQLTYDDLSGQDAMDNLAADGALTNVISLSEEYVIHVKELSLPDPGILFAATDGCFGYYSTPMQFEYMLLENLLQADSVHDWEERMHKELLEISGDDCALIGMAFGFGSFQKLQALFRARKEELFLKYVDHIAEKDIDQKRHLWERYKPNYLKYC